MREPDKPSPPQTGEALAQAKAETARRLPSNKSAESLNQELLLAQNLGLRVARNPS